MSPAGCSHVNGFKVDNWKQNLRVIYQCFVWTGTAETRKRKVKKKYMKRQTSSRAARRCAALLCTGAQCSHDQLRRARSEYGFSFIPRPQDRGHSLAYWIVCGAPDVSQIRGIGVFVRGKQ